MSEHVNVPITQQTVLGFLRAQVDGAYHIDLTGHFLRRPEPRHFERLDRVLAKLRADDLVRKEGERWFAGPGLRLAPADVAELLPPPVTRKGRLPRGSKPHPARRPTNL
jgi:hypothetical protein